jgi:hypothetical protein
MPSLPIGIRVESSATDLLTIEHDCPACRASLHASVLATGRGSAEALIFLRAAAEAEAAEAAVDAIDETARVLAALAACPRRGARDQDLLGGRRRHHFASSLGLGVTLGALVGFGGAIASVLVTHSLYAPAWITLGVLVAAAFSARRAVVRTRNDLAQADLRVEWIEPPRKKRRARSRALA